MRGALTVVLVLLLGQACNAQDVSLTARNAAEGSLRSSDLVLSYRAPEDSMFPTQRSAGSDSGGAESSGFVVGMRGGFERFPRPIGSPLYFESPFIDTSLRPLALYHEFPEGSLLGGGDLTVLAVQARLALTERLQFTATADGHADLEADALPFGEGFNDLAAGLKYAFYVDYEAMAIASVGVRWRLSNGSRDVFQGIEDEVSAYLTAAKEIDRFRLVADVVGRVTTHHSQGNDSLSWDMSASYELTETFFPMLEYHGFVYLSNGKRLAVRDGLLDYGNLGAADVRGSMAHWGTGGFRWTMREGVSFGAGYGFRLRGDDDIFDRRFTADLIITF